MDESLLEETILKDSSVDGRRMRHESTSSGFTIIELLVTTGILVAVVGVLLLALYSGIAVWEKAGGYDMKRMETMLAIEEMERDVRNTFLFYAINFRGDSTGVRFAGMEPGEVPGGVCRNLIEIEYFYDSGTHTFQRRSRRYPFGSVEGGEARRVVSGVAGVKIGYAYSPESRGGRPMWVESWDSRTNLPAALRVEFEFEGASTPQRIGRTVCLAVK